MASERNPGIRRQQPTVLLISPARPSGHEGDFGDPHLVALGSFVQARTGARVELLDLSYERLLARPEPERAFRPEFGVVGISCYSSYDYLSAFYLGVEVRRRNPGAVLVVGGYHASARPGDFLNVSGSELEEASPFDHVVVGEGELPLARIVEAAGRGERLPQQVLGPEPLPSLDELPPLDWSLLDRYLPIGRAVGTQPGIHLSRGCPYQCSFCMERSKGEAAWRAWSPDRAEAELRRLDAWLGLKGRTLFLSDAVFGLHAAWRREMLERLARLDLGLRKTWALSRVDLLGPGDLERYQRANVGLGFGLESGDPRMLGLIGKARDPEAFLDRFRALAAEAARSGFPWGANLIAGHPGETEESLHRSAAFAAELFLRMPGLTGFLSVDPFRFYPGSLVDKRLADYAAAFGTRVHRPRWWNYSEQAFTSEWVDPSAELGYRRREALTARLFGPIADGIAKRFAYAGPASDYFRRSVAHAQRLFEPPARLSTLADYRLWRCLTGQSRATFAADREAKALFRQARRDTLAAMGRGSPRIAAALVAEPRERYVPPEHALESWRDAVVPLTGDGRSTLSALHAYLVNYTLLELGEGDRLLEAGSGTGYGAAVAARLVGARGRVVTFEVVPELARQAHRNLARRRNVRVVCGDAFAVERLPRFNKAVLTCAVARVPRRLLDALPEGGRLVAPVGRGGGNQTLTLFVRRGSRIHATQHGPVRYVPAASRRAAPSGGSPGKSRRSQSK
ncbi:MAG TPA: radical SAM protein [Planctomycetota bacterium]|nr:radical SAM protein [Planctomycetota bacterium]